MRFIFKLNQRLGETVRDRVVRDAAEGRFAGPNRIRTATRAIAALVVLTPYLVGAAGIALVVMGFPNIFALVVGGVVLAAALYLRPRAHRNTHPTLRRDAAPVLFGLLDAISERLEAPRIDGVHVFGSFNAYMAEFGAEDRVVGIGAPLWLAMTPPERLAILAHEVAHLANDDPARGKIIGAATDTISRWFELFTPPAFITHENVHVIMDDRGIEGRMVSGIFGWVMGGIALAYERLIYAESQRAEYFADLLAARVAGAAAMQSSLKKIILAPLGDKALAHLHYDGKTKVAAFEAMARGVVAPSEADAREHYDEAVRSLHTVDSSHPPTRFRLEVVGAAGAASGSLDAEGLDWAAIDRELSEAFAAEEKKVLAAILIQ